MRLNRPYVLGMTVAMTATAAFAPAASDGITFQTKAPTDVRVQQFVFGPNSRTGWHHHPGWSSWW